MFPDPLPLQIPHQISQTENNYPFPPKGTNFEDNSCSHILFSMKKLLLILLIVSALVSCKTEVNQPPATSIKNLVVSPSFNWQTSRNITFLITKASSGVIRIMAEDGTTMYYKGFYNGLTEVLPVAVKIPSHIKKVHINEAVVELTSDEISVNLTDLTYPTFKDGGITRGAVSHWRMNENTGTILGDEVGGNPGTIIGATWQTGVSGSALDFNGTTDWVQIPERPNLDITQSITLCAWIKTKGNETAKIAQKGDWDGFGLGQSKWTGWTCSMQMADNVNHQLIWDQGIPIFNEWYFLAFTYDGTTMKFYVNGQLKSSAPVTGLLRNNNRPFSIGSDGGNQKFVNGLIDEVSLYNNALTQQEITTIYNTLPNVDADGDGVLNIDDDYPSDPLRAFDNFYPASGFGSLAFEDLWPSQGDYDFNDLILDYRFKTVTSSANLVAEIFVTIDIKAIGAGFKNGFGFQLNQNFPANNIQASGYELTESYANISANGTETGQSQTTIIVFDNASKLLVSQGGFGVNVNPNNPWVEPDTLNILMDLTDATYTSAQIDIQNWNPFLIENGERGKEIHLADHQPTTLAEPSYFGTFEDNTIPAQGIYYKTKNNLPWAIEFPVAFDYAIEKHEISTAHLKFLGWAGSSGANYSDWYLDLPGYRNAANVYFHTK